MISTDTVNFDLKLKNCIIMPYCITPILVYSSNNQILLLNNSMRAGFQYLRFVNKILNPLTVAICRQNKDIIACLMKEIILASTKDPNILQRIEDDLVEINFRGSTSKLEYFYRMVFDESSENLLKFSQIKEKPFVALESYNKPINSDNFINKSSTIEKELLTYRVSKIRFNLESFSEESVQVLESLVSCPNSEILKTPIIQAILLHK